MNESKSILAKLLAKENITVRYGNYHTASFDVNNRTLCLPMWKYENKGLLDMLVGHEVGHALYTPVEGWHDCDIEVPGIPRAFINIVEDIRIEKKIQRQYPGLVRSFKQGYQHLFDNDFFEIADKDISKMSFMNRLNIKSKLRDLVEVPFSTTEQYFVDMAMKVETWDDVINVCKALLDFAEQQEETNENIQSTQEEATTSSQDQNSESQAESSGSNVEDGGSDSDFQEQINSAMDNLSESEDNQQPSGYRQDGDGDEVEDNQEQLSGQEGSRGLADKPLTDKPSHRVETDEALRRNEHKLLDIDENGSQPKIVNGFRKEQLKDMIVSYKTVMESRQKRMAETPSGCKYDIDQYASAFSEFMSETKKATAVMAKEFEMRKAAYQYSRAQTARSGSLDVNKLHSYKYNDDIFSRVTKLADAKSHGMIMLIDYSGSMHGIMSSVIKQVLNLSTFCKKVNIPFDVYGFTNGRHETEATLLPGDIDHRDVRIFNLMSSSMNKSEYDTAFFQMFMQTCGYGMPYGNFCGEYDQLGGTPLNESLVAMPHIVQQFKNRHPVQRVINVIITDGDAQHMYTKEDVSASVHTRGIAISTNNKIIKAYNNHNLTVQLTDNLRSLGCVNIGFFLAERRYDSTRAISRATGSWDQSSFRQASKMLNKHKFASYDNTLGYDRFFVVKADRRTLNTDNDDFEIRDNATKGEITRAFKKFANSKKGNRVLASQFAQMVA